MIRGYFVAKQPVKVISLLEGMLDLPAELEFGPKDVPLPSILTYNEFIKGFISIGDLDSAVKWFKKMLAQSENGVANTENEEALYRLMKSTPWPHRVAWSTLSHTLAEKGVVSQLNKIYKVYCSLGLPSSAFDPILVAHANMWYI
jgi:pentatricopeptide repeat protein